MNLVFVGNSLIYIASFLWVLEMIPQIRKTIKTKNVSGISLAYFQICLSAYILYCIGNVILGNINIFYAILPSTFLNLVMLILILKYREK